VAINSLPDDPAALKELIADMAADHQTQIAQLEQRIRLLNLIIYGPKSEKSKRLMNPFLWRSQGWSRSSGRDDQGAGIEMLGQEGLALGIGSCRRQVLEEVA